MGEIKSKIQELKKKLIQNGSKKLIEKVAIIAIIGVICLIAGSVFLEKPKNTSSGAAVNGTIKKTQADKEAVETAGKQEDESKQEMEKHLQSILTKIKGAGKVDVMITFDSGNESVPAYDIDRSESTTSEKDKEGGTRSIKQSDNKNSIIYEENDGVKKPFVVKEILPKVKGVVIVADGARDSEVKSNLARATEALLDVASHKIQVFERNSN